MSYTRYTDKKLIDAILEHEGMTISKLASDLGYSRSHIHNMLSRSGELSRSGRKHIELYAKSIGLPGDNNFRDLNEIREVLNNFEKSNIEQLGADHQTVWSTLMWVVKEADSLPMDKLPEK